MALLLTVFYSFKRNSQKKFISYQLCKKLQSAFPEGYIPYIFTTSSSGDKHNGNFGGIAEADAYCQSHIPNLATDPYKIEYR